MKLLTLLTIVCAVSMITALKFKHHNAIKSKSQSKSWYSIKIDWMYTSATGKLWFDVYDGDSAYADYFTESQTLSFYPGEYEIGSAYQSLSLGKYLYLSVSFLGPDAFSRYDTATNLGLDYFQLTRISGTQIEEIHQ